MEKLNLQQSAYRTKILVKTKNKLCIIWGFVITL